MANGANPETRLERLGKRLWFRVLLVTSPLWLTLLAEGGLRSYYFLRYAPPGRSYGIWRYDPELHATHKENSYNSNASLNDFGFRNQENVLEPKPEGSLRVIAYGGSTTFCYNLFNEEAWPLRLQGLLREMRPGGSKDQVLNGGVILWSLGQIAAKIRRDVPRLKPDYVLLYSGLNEFSNEETLKAEGRSLKDSVAAKRYGEFARTLDQNNWFVRHSILYKAFRNYVINPVRSYRQSQVTDGPRWRWPKEPSPESLTNYLETLHVTLDYLKANGVKTVFIEELSGRDDPQNRLLTSYSRAGAKVASQWGALVVPAESFFEKHPGDRGRFFVETGVHFREEAARQFAEHLYESVFAKF